MPYVTHRVLKWRRRRPRTWPYAVGVVVLAALVIALAWGAMR